MLTLLTKLTTLNSVLIVSKSFYEFYMFFIIFLFCEKLKKREKMFIKENSLKIMSMSLSVTSIRVVNFHIRS